MSNKFDEFGIAENFSKWCFDLEYKDIPNEVIHKIKLIFMDSLGLIFASRNEDYIKAIKKSFTDIGNCTVPGHLEKLSPSDAIMLNGTAIHGEDFDDTFEGTPVHVGSVMCSSLLTAAEYYKLKPKEILKGLNLNIKPGEVHAIMGPNGSGKSTLSNILSGKKGYEVNGNIKFEGENLLELETEERAHKGIFLAFQYPLEIPGVNTNTFLKTSINAIKKARGEKELDAIEFLKLIKQKSLELKFDQAILNRQLNVGFSGGEKKKNEILQMSILNPKLSILDETDSGLDIDALRIVSEGVNSLRNKNNSFLIITHYQRLLDYIKPDFVHVLKNGQIIKSGNFELAKELEKVGYENFN